MKTYWRIVVLAAIFILFGQRSGNLLAQETTAVPSVLHIQQTQTNSGSQNGVPTYLATYQVLGGAKTAVDGVALTGTLSLKNDSPNFSQVLWLLVYWQGTCPANDINLTQVAGYLWSDIIKNPSQSDSKFSVNLVFPQPLAMTGCVGLYYGGGPLIEGQVTMTADLNLTYKPSSANANTVIDVSGEYCFGQTGGCQNATAEGRWSTAGVYPPGNWFAPPGSNQSSSGGNETAEASGAEGREGDSASV